MNMNIKFKNGVRVGKNVIIKTTDGGIIHIGEDSTIEDNSYLYSKYGEICIGKETFIGVGTQIVSLERIAIGNDCLIAAYSIIRDSNHKFAKNQLIRKQGNEIGSINIGNDIWLGAHSVITPNTTIRQGAVIGANAVVTKDVKEYTIVGGVSAKYIKDRI